MVQTPTRRYSPAEYLELEANADYRSEYRDGEIVPMTGGTTNHNELALNFAAALKQVLRRQGFKVYMGDVRLWIPTPRQYTYPDVMMIQGQPVYADKSRTTVTNPQVIVEVLSKSTQNYDHGEKFMYYRSIPDLQEYILVAQQQYYVMQYAKMDDGKRLLSEHKGEEAEVVLQSANFSIQLLDLYDGVDFSLSEE